MMALLLMLLPGQETFTPPVPDASNAPVPFPAVAREQDIDGEVDYVLDVDERGRVIAVRFTALPGAGIGLEKELEAAFRKWTFAPARRNGVPARGVYSGRLVLAAVHVPLATGRMYAAEFDAVWKAAEQAIRRLRMGAERRDRANGLLITSWERGRSGLDEYVRQLHVFVSPFQPPARVYVGSMTDRRGVRLYNMPEAGSEFFAALETELGEAGHAIPELAPRRAQRARKLLPAAADSACLDRLADEARSSPDAAIDPPTKIHEVQFIFPLSQSKLGREGLVVVEGEILDDGFFLARRVVEPSDLRDEFVTATLGAASLWRFRPTRQGGCAVPTKFKLTAQFSLRR